MRTINIDDLKPINITPSNDIMPIGFYCDISKARLDDWEGAAHERVMMAVDRMIYDHKCREMLDEFFRNYADSSDLIWQLGTLRLFNVENNP